MGAGTGCLVVASSKTQQSIIETSVQQRCLQKASLRIQQLCQAAPVRHQNDAARGEHLLCRAQSGEVSFSNGSGSAQFSGRPDGSGIAAVPQQVKSTWQGWKTESRRLSSQLRSYGVAGLLAYGLLNTLYYSGAFLIIWLYFAKVPRGLGWSAASKQFAAVMSLTWAASQVTKIPRAALALFFAPIADGCLIFLQARLRLRTRRNAFLVVVALCLVTAAAVFGLTVAMWA